MKILKSTYQKNCELPLKLKVSFKPIFNYLELISNEENHYLNASAIKLLEEYKAYPELKDGFEDMSLLTKYNSQIDRLLDLLFPDILQTNEIKAISIPFDFTAFKLSKRFENIINDAGEDYEYQLRNYEDSKVFILSCAFILAYCYDTYIDFRRPFYFDIPDKNGIEKHYRSLYNGDFFKVTPLENAPKITKEDIDILIDNFDNIDLWIEKFPPKSYLFEGFGIMNLFDVSADQSISKIKENLLRVDQNTFIELEKSISKLYQSQTIQLGFSTYNLVKEGVTFDNNKTEKSFIKHDNCAKSCADFFCEGVLDKVFKNEELIAISNIENYGKKTNNNKFYQSLKNQLIQSLILVPIKLKDNVMGILELVSTKKQELNSINAYKLNDVIPVFKIAVERYMEEYENKLESIIQENYTSLHPSVKWKFFDEVETYLYELELNPKAEINLDDIIFENVIPLYGQSDIKGSSIARNEAIQQDLVKQLKLASKVIEKAKLIYNLPIYNDLLFRIKECLQNIRKGLDSGDEISLTDFLRKDIYPAFNHLKQLDSKFKKDVDEYMSHIDPEIHVVYEKRKEYERSVNKLNEELAKFIDKKQEEAQKMFPHYFERYKTDGIDYNMYIGQSLVKNHTYNEIYLENLRLWQLQMMCELENVAYNLKSKLQHPLEVASLILIHSNPLSIKFRMDEKRFDVDGAYNIRYEIIKKRIDKALIKNTDERLTQPGKIAIVYSQYKDAQEYLKYIQYLQANNYLKNGAIEYLDLEDLQGITGLKALRVSVNYNQINESNTSLEEIIGTIEQQKN
ncbi:GAF domain-containing protein [Lutibacter sp. TH_r2]|uniref:GAF domain-containing protein n=1 Tax=Lutibacter sp. TH_r2 TaxID=3082083 RepID=UPI00295419F1|nr:GAF domain-containing protein [Lutibacter sp. TH_r2]MDV7187349.1 GAF domain-containing protein [Lutibacter sp. TH_r2]